MAVVVPTPVTLAKVSVTSPAGTLVFSPTGVFGGGVAAACCVTVIVCPPTRIIVPVRALLLVLAATE